MSVRSYLTLSELASQIRTVVANVFGARTFWVVADVTDHKYYPAKGTHYFSLAEKDPVAHTLAAKMAAVAWKEEGAAAITAFEQTTGQLFKSDIHVLVNVSVIYHKQYGLQLVLNAIDTNFTTGLLEQQRRDTLERLLKEYPGSVQRAGNRFITTNNQLQLARVIQHVAVVTSGGAAGYQDFKNALDTNPYGYQIRVSPYFTAVQGEANADILARRLVDVYESGVKYDAVVIIRGGGAQTDLLLFNQFSVARVVAKFPIPVIAGIGHQVNETIVDLMAHTSVKTPSVAAEMIITHNRKFEDDVQYYQQRIVIKSQQLLHRKKESLSQLNTWFIYQFRMIRQHEQTRLSALSRHFATRPAVTIGSQYKDLEHLAGRIQSYSTKYIAVSNNNLRHAGATIRLLDPAHILKRGFALLYQDNRVVSDPDRLQPGGQVEIHTATTIISAAITHKTNTQDDAHKL